MLRANFHTHTTLCDGHNTPEEMAQQAVKLGFRQLGFSGHMDPDIHMDIQEYLRQISALRERYRGRLDILTGIELDTLYDPGYAKMAEYVIGSTHFPDVECNRGYTHILADSCRNAAKDRQAAAGGCAGYGGKSSASRAEDHPISVDMSQEHMQLLADTYFGGDFYKLARNYYETEAKVYDRLHCTFVGHFDLVVRYNDEMHFLDEEDARYTGPALEAMEYLVSEGVPFEINCGAVNRGRKKDFYPGTFLLKSLREMGGEILISSDAHDREHIDGAFDRAVKHAMACGFTHTNILEHGQDGKLRLRQIPLDLL